MDTHTSSTQNVIKQILGTQENTGNTSNSNIICEMESERHRLDWKELCARFHEKTCATNLVI